MRRSGKLHLVLCLIVAGMIIFLPKECRPKRTVTSITGTVNRFQRAVVAGVEVTPPTRARMCPPKPSPMAMGFMSSPNLFPGQYSVRIKRRTDLKPCSVPLSHLESTEDGPHRRPLKVGAEAQTVTVHGRVLPVLDLDRAVGRYRT